MGLTNMRERAAALGGQLEIESAPNQGVKVRVSIEAPL
jgi:signal transduction histidine kinase